MVDISEVAQDMSLVGETLAQPTGAYAAVVADGDKALELELDEMEALELASALPCVPCGTPLPPGKEVQQPLPTTLSWSEAECVAVVQKMLPDCSAKPATAAVQAAAIWNFVEGMC